MTDSATDAYEFTKIEYSHPEPRYRAHGYVSVHIVDGHGVDRVAGASIEVA